jgi:putative two-component system response regulator
MTTVRKPLRTAALWLGGIGLSLLVASIAVRLVRGDEPQALFELLVAAVAFGIVAALLGSYAMRVRSLLEQAGEREETLRGSQGRLAAILENAPAVIYAKDLEGHYLFANKAFESVTGSLPLADEGKTAFDLFSPATAAALSANDRRVLESAEPLKVEETVEIDGLEQTFLSTKFPLKGPDGDAYAVCGISTDLSERKRIEADLRDAKLEILQRLALAAEYRDDETGEHQQRVGEISARLAERIGLPPRQIWLIRHAATLHDVGKIGIPDRILTKPGRLTPREFQIMERHTTIGAGILAGSRIDILRMSEQIALTHHEHWGGGGYPQGLSGDAIPLVGRIAAVADVYDALTHDRAYRPAWPRDDALQEIGRLSGEQFDPLVVEALHQVLEAPISVSQPLAGQAVAATPSMAAAVA